MGEKKSPLLLKRRCKQLVRDQGRQLVRDQASQ
jgi:hypothetical protein